MWDDQARLRQRRLLVRPADRSSGFVFHGILDLVRQRAGSELARQLREAHGVQGLADLAGMYPSAQLLDLVDGAMDRLRPVTALDDSSLLEQLGAHTVEAYLDLPMGRLAAHLYRGSAAGMLGSFPAAFRAAHTFVDMEAEVSGPRRAARFVLRDMFLGPAYTAGILRAGLRLVCRLDAQVELQDAGADGCHFTLDVRW